MTYYWISYLFRIRQEVIYEKTVKEYLFGPFEQKVFEKLTTFPQKAKFSLTTGLSPVDTVKYLPLLSTSSTCGNTTP